jgi:hypothetical protein
MSDLTASRIRETVDDADNGIQRLRLKAILPECATDEL